MAGTEADEISSSLRTTGQLVPTHIHTVADSEFRCYVVPASQRSIVAQHLKSATFNVATPHWSSAAPGEPCVHVPSAGGADPPDDDGEPAAALIGSTLLARASDDVAVLVWRRFGGTMLGVSSGGLRAAYQSAICGGGVFAWHRVAAECVSASATAKGNHSGMVAMKKELEDVRKEIARLKVTKQLKPAQTEIAQTKAFTAAFVRRHCSDPPVVRPPQSRCEYSAGIILLERVAGVLRALLLDLHGQGGCKLEVPKGHIEHGEEARDAATRELTEETGFVGYLSPLHELPIIEYKLPGMGTMNVPIEYKLPGMGTMNVRIPHSKRVYKGDDCRKIVRLFACTPRGSTYHFGVSEGPLHWVSANELHLVDTRWRPSVQRALSMDYDALSMGAASVNDRRRMAHLATGMHYDLCRVAQLESAAATTASRIDRHAPYQPQHSTTQKLLTQSICKTPNSRPSKLRVQ